MKQMQLCQYKRTSLSGSTSPSKATEKEEAGVDLNQA